MGRLPARSPQCNAVAMEALPIFLDKLVNAIVAVIISGAAAAGGAVERRLAAAGGCGRSAHRPAHLTEPRCPMLPQPQRAATSPLRRQTRRMPRAPRAVTAVLVFGEVVPQAVCKRYGLQAS